MSMNLHDSIISRRTRTTATREYIGLLLTWNLDSHIKRRVNGPISAICLFYVENGAICGTETAKLTGRFVSQAHSKYIWSFYMDNNNRYIKKDRSGSEKETYDILFTAK